MVRRMFLAAAVLTLFALPMSAQSDPTADAIKQNMAKWSTALMSKDAATIDRMLAPGYIATDGSGKRYDKAAYLGMIKEGATYSEWQAGPEQVIRNGDAVVHMGEGSMAVTAPDGTASKAHVVWTVTWVKGKGGKWVCLAAQWVEHPVS
jgi:ketosteroid isomerase-like protein